MPVTPTYPGVYVEEIPSAVHTITGVATSIAAFVGYTDSGLDNRATEVLSFSDFERSFGGLASDSELSYAVQQFFLNGGSDAFIVRVPKHASTPAMVTLLSGVTAGSAPSLVVTMLSNGTWSDQVIIDVDYDGVSDTNSFNFTFTNLADGTVETFDDVTMDNTKSNFVLNVVNDVDSGSQLANVSLPSATPAGRPAAVGITGNDITLANIKNDKTYTIQIKVDTTPTATTVEFPFITQGATIPQSIPSVCAQLQSQASAALATLIPGAPERLLGQTRWPANGSMSRFAGSPCFSKKVCTAARNGRSSSQMMNRFGRPSGSILVHFCKLCSGKAHFKGRRHKMRTL
jgi:uncharacterized protein